MSKFRVIALTALLSLNLVFLSTGSAIAPASVPDDEDGTQERSTQVRPELKAYEIEETGDPAFLNKDPTGKFIEDELLVKLEEGTTWEEELEILDKYNLKIKWRHDQFRVVKLVPGEEEQVKEALAQEPAVEQADLNVLGFATGANTPNDPYYSQQWYLSGQDCKLFLFTAPYDDPMTFVGIDRKLSCPPP